MYPILMILIAVMIAVLGMMAIPAFKLQRKLYKKTGKHPKGHYMGMGIAIGIPLGMPIGISMGNIGIGPAIGCAIGCAIGVTLERQHEKELRPLTKEEKAMKKRGIYSATVTLIIGLIAFLVTYLLR